MFVGSRLNIANGINIVVEAVTCLVFFDSLDNVLLEYISSDGGAVGGVVASGMLPQTVGITPPLQQQQQQQQNSSTALLTAITPLLHNIAKQANPESMFC